MDQRQQRRRPSEELLALRGRLGARSRHHPDDPANVDDRRELRALTLEEHVRRVVDEFPPLTVEQRERIAAALHTPSSPA